MRGFLLFWRLGMAQPDRTAELRELLDRRILILDGAMGTMIQRYGLDEAGYRGERFADHPRDLKGANDVLGLTQPDDHRRDPSPVPRGRRRHHRDQHLQRAGDLAGRLRPAAVRLRDQHRGRARSARRAARRRSRRPTVRASSPARSGPTNRTASLSPDVNNPALPRRVTFDELVDAYYEQTRGLVDGGVDILLPETTFDTLNLKAALFAIEKFFDDTGIRLPVIASITITDASGRTLSGQTVEAFWNSISHAPLLAVGINCALGAKEMRAAHRGAVARSRRSSSQLLSERRPAERARRLRRDAGR